MHVQHSAPFNNSKDSLVNPSKDFELIIYSKSAQKIVGNIQFQYLSQYFTASIIIQPQSIQIKAEQAFEGIQLSAPIIADFENAKNGYLENATLTPKGYQNIVWLILDFIHLYNVIRLKPGKLVALYRQTWNQITAIDTTIQFGKININEPIAQIAAQQIAKAWKLALKYEFSNPLSLLSSIQQLLGNYPLPFERNEISNLSTAFFVQ